MLEEQTINYKQSTLCCSINDKHWIDSWTRGCLALVLNTIKFLHIATSTIVSQGNEGVEVKEGSVDNTIENNWIYMQKDPDSGGAYFVLECIWRTS